MSQALQSPRPLVRPSPAPAVDPIGALRVVWNRVRLAFPPHTAVHRAGPMTLAVQWQIPQDGAGRASGSVLLSFDADWLLRLSQATSVRKLLLAAEASAVVREGLGGYRPDPRWTQTRVIVIG